MPSYRGTADTPSKAKAIVAVVAVHALLAAAILTGLNVSVVSKVVERLQTIDVRLVPPPQPPPPPPREPKKAELEEGAAGKKAEPSPIVAPKPRIPVRSPLSAAPVAGTGSATTSGAAISGSGTGAGGSGAGRGGGGADYSRFTPARLVRNLSRGDYRRLAGGLLPAGRAMVSLRVETNGVASDCRIVRSSGQPAVDSGLCPLITERLRFRPALDDQGRPIPYGLNYVATWSL
jgi:protein TonB